MKITNQRLKSINSNKCQLISKNQQQNQSIYSIFNNNESIYSSYHFNNLKKQPKKHPIKEVKQLPWEDNFYQSNYQIEEFQEKLNHLQKKRFCAESRAESLKLRDTKGYVQLSKKKKQSQKKKIIIANNQISNTSSNCQNN